MARAPKPSSPVSLTGSERFVILHGPDRFLQEIYVQNLREALEKHHGEGAIDILRYDAADTSSGMNTADILDECRSMGLMSSFKLVIVDNADALVKADDDNPPARGGKTPRQILEAYADDPSPDAVLVLRAHAWRPGNLDKAVAKVGQVIKCEPMSEAKAAQWARGRAQKRYNASIDNDAVRSLIQAVGTETGRLDSELSKLALAAGEGNAITAELVTSMVGVTREEELWGIQQTLLGASARDGLAHLKDLLEVSRHDPVPLMFAYVEAARKLHIGACIAERRTSEQSARGPMKLWGPSAHLFGEVVSRGSRTGSSRARSVFLGAVEADAGLKSGLGKPRRVLETLTVQLSAEPKST